ncbi:GNAT family N-acetyltransferase [Pedococcus sp. NPDC057267]|uniref:GNAT family N-acetyltransferase n=1 Tax=Pedococcus sp. NPDC057267 TaxID=3346077 RepID=UPI003638175D
MPPAAASRELRLDRVDFLDPRVQRLVEEVQAHYAVIYGGPDDSPVDADEFAPPRGCFLLGSVDGEPVAMGGWRMRPELTDVVGGRSAEVKRMYVADGARRQGHARRVLGALEQTAREAGAELLVLETGTMQPEAIALYEASGYAPTVAFGHYADSELSRYFAKRL